MPYAVITGSSGGIGKVMCDLFAANGYTVIGVDRTVVENFDHHFIPFNIATLFSAVAAAELKDRIGRITGNQLDVLVNNAAVQVVKPFTELTTEDWQQTLDTNLMAPFWLIQMLYPLLKETRGNVVNVASVHSTQTKRNFTAYATSKGALVTMTKALAIELAPEVRINVLLPAATDTPMLRDGFKESPKKLSELEKFHPLGRIATPEEIGRAVLFLASSNASFITGASLTVDGGIGVCLHDPA